MLYKLKCECLEKENCEPLIWVVNRVFIIPKFYRFEKVKGFKSYFLVMTLTRDKKISTSLIMNK